MELPDTHLKALKAIAGGPPDQGQISPDSLVTLPFSGVELHGEPTAY